MPITAALLDIQVDRVVHDVDQRWTMAYPAALGDHSDRYFDTANAAEVVAHPLFAVCPEWQAIVWIASTPGWLSPRGCLRPRAALRG